MQYMHAKYLCFNLHSIHRVYSLFKTFNLEVIYLSPYRLYTFGISSGSISNACSVGDKMKCHVMTNNAVVVFYKNGSEVKKIKYNPE